MNNLNQIVNPIYTTAKGTAMTLAAGGDKDAIALYPYLDLDEIKRGNQTQTPPEIQRIYVIAQEARFSIYNNAALSRGNL